MDFMRKLVLVVLGGIALGFTFWVATTPIAKAAVPSGKCIVCHFDQSTKGPNAGPHEVDVNCDKVDQYLSDHPDDFAGPCQATPAQNP